MRLGKDDHRFVGPGKEFCLLRLTFALRNHTLAYRIMQQLRFEPNAQDDTFLPLTSTLDMLDFDRTVFNCRNGKLQVQRPSVAKCLVELQRVLKYYPGGTQTRIVFVSKTITEGNGMIWHSGLVVSRSLIFSVTILTWTPCPSIK